MLRVSRNFFFYRYVADCRGSEERRGVRLGVNRDSEDAVLFCVFYTFFNHLRLALVQSGDSERITNKR